jgi:hypothetical protein
MSEPGSGGWIPEGWLSVGYQIIDRKNLDGDTNTTTIPFWPSLLSFHKVRADLKRLDLVALDREKCGSCDQAGPPKVRTTQFGGCKMGASCTQLFQKRQAHHLIIRQGIRVEIEFVLRQQDAGLGYFVRSTSC